MTVPAPHGASCPNCGAPVRFRWAQAVQTTCAYCRSVLVRRDLDLARVGQQADFPHTGSPIQLGTEGRWRDQNFVVVGRLSYQWARGRWNEWHCVLNSGHSAWLSDAQLEYAMTMQADPAGVLPSIDRIQVGTLYFFDNVPYEVASITEAEYIGTEGDLPFTTTARHRCRFVDLMNVEGRFGTVDGSETPARLYLGEYLTFDQLALRNLREFEGW
ncbi:MAG: DUF4178 domain-containing protein [Gemmatimonas sp.]|jgi:hypothetical protein|uniref:DUF4178 domain-containing protein n=1 Tax=Gemmatimonas sp. UBA7669 TaxID=1946568 RepID=UPI0025BF02B2|nr:DUF4178 domain-containing protein [Gemmatimonas sp. UBA7669]MBA3917926.1 DUF4178 domain-containing protein [Gemmatimonas sp.]